MIDATVGSYRITGLLGEGGMGRVYVAEHVMLGKRAAIKVLLPQLSANTEIVNRFFNEARASSRLKHPGVVDVYDFGKLGDGSAYIVMELLEGESLAALVARERGVAIDRMVDIARQVANALAVAHERGIVHRDLKPDNVFLVEDLDMRGGLRAKILDFGIAKLTEESGLASGQPGQPSGTRTGALIGTPAYMSPEQCRGAGKVDHRADVYALGCVMFEMATGRPPFQGEGWGDIIAAHLFQEPASLTGIVPAPFDALVAKMLAKTPEERVQTMREVATGLGQPASSRAPTGPRALPERVVASASAAPTPTGHHDNATRFQSKTTLTGASGEVAASDAAPPRRRGWTVAALGLLLVAGAGIFVAVRLAPRTTARAPVRVEAPPDVVIAAANERAPSAGHAGGAGLVAAAGAAHAGDGLAPTVAPLATLTILSQPKGADVVRAADGVRVGRTPWTTQYPASPGEAVFVLRLKGYRSAEVVTKLDQDRIVSTVLERSSKSPSASRVASPPPAATAPSQPATPTMTHKNGLAADPFAN